MKRLAVLLLGLAGCDEAVPAEPTWAEHVAPILAANCGRCHGAPALGGAPRSFRLDAYEDTSDGQGGTLRGAAAMAEFVAARVRSGTMPPTLGLTEAQVETVVRWADQRTVDDDGLPLPPPRGARPGNRAPDLTTLITPQGEEGTPEARVVTIAYELLDPDRDRVVGALRVVDGSQATRLDVGPLHEGHGVISLDATRLFPGAYQLRARLDDGSGVIDVGAGRLDIDHHGQAAPWLTPVSPAGDDLVADADGPAVIQLRVGDVDSAQLLVDAALVDRSADRRLELATDLVVGAGSIVTLAYFPSELAAGDRWQVEASVRDGADRPPTLALGPAFTISHDTTADGFAAIRDEILVPRCGACHGEALRIPGVVLDVRALADSADRAGVASSRSAIYRRVVLEQSMPPASTTLVDDGGADLTPAERARLATWLRAGAPEVAP
jgi:mono/diheme cytochrome c family protein